MRFVNAAEDTCPPFCKATLRRIVIWNRTKTRALEVAALLAGKVSWPRLRKIWKPQRRLRT
jgi:glutamyl-tRNA reductase